MPAGLENTRPKSVPVLVTVSATICGSNITVTFRAWSMLTAHDPAPAHAPLQPVKVEPASGMASRATTAPLVKLALHTAPQLIPPGLEAMIPVPAPFFITLSITVLGGGAVPNVAVRLRGAVMLTVHGPVPVQAPLQPVKVEPVPAAAVSVTAAPEG